MSNEDKVSSNPWDPRTLELGSLQFYGDNLINMEEVLYIRREKCQIPLVPSTEIENKITILHEIKFKNGDHLKLIEMIQDNNNG